MSFTFKSGGVPGPIYDYFDRRLSIGDKIVYPVLVGSSSTLVLAAIVDIVCSPATGKTSLRIKRLRQGKQPIGKYPWENPDRVALHRYENAVIVPEDSK